MPANLGLEGRAADKPVPPCVAPGTSASTSDQLGLSQHQTTHGEDHLVQHMQILSAHEIAVNHIAVVCVPLSDQVRNEFLCRSLEPTVNLD